MSRVKAIEKEVQSLSPEELTAFRQWFREFDAAEWDRQIEEDVRSGKLDDLVDEALRDHKTGKSTEL